MIQNLMDKKYVYSTILTLLTVLLAFPVSALDNVGSSFTYDGLSYTILTNNGEDKTCRVSEGSKNGDNW